jgi:transcriptional regulator with XRE-family HTH domain
MDGCIVQRTIRVMVRPRPRQYRKTFIREWRKHRGLTLEQVAERAGMTPGNLSHLERGKQAYTQHALEALASALNTDPASLLMRDPTQADAIWSIWDQAKEGEKRQITEVAKTIIRTNRTGTDD